MQAFLSCVNAFFDLISFGLFIPFIASLGQRDQSKISLAPVINIEVSALPFLLTLVAGFLVKNIIGGWINYRQSLFIHKTFVETSQQLFKSFYEQSFEDYCRQNSAESIRRIKQAPSDFTNHVLLPLLALVTDTIVTICVVAFLFWYDYKVVFALAVVLFPILLTYYLFKTKIVSRIKRNFQEEIPKSNIIISQGIDAFAEAKIYRKEDFFMKRFSDINSQTSRHLADLRTAAFIPQRILEIVAVFSLGLIFTLSHFTGNQSGIVLTGIVLLAFYKLGPALNRILINATEVAAFAYTIDLIKRPFGKGQEKHTHPTSEFKFSETICADKISFNYKDTDTMILNQFSFIINKGDFVIVEGPSGAGKSTLLNILSGLLTIRSGKIQIDGVLLSAENIQQWQSKIAFVPQSGVVIDDTILANVAFGEDPDKIDVARVNEVVGLVGLLDFVGQLSGTIHHQIGENGLTISGGQRQRLLLARALYRNPQVLIVDEVTNQLDYDNKIKLLEAIRSLTLRGLTVIFATHDTLVKTFADKTISVGSANKEFPEKDILMASIDHNDVSVR